MISGRCGSNSPCEQLCYELHDGMYECDCTEGYELHKNGYSCQGERHTQRIKKKKKRKSLDWIFSVVENSGYSKPFFYFVSNLSWDDGWKCIKLLNAFNIITNIYLSIHFIGRWFRISNRWKLCWFDSLGILYWFSSVLLETDKNNLNWNSGKKAIPLVRNHCEHCDWSMS